MTSVECFFITIWRLFITKLKVILIQYVHFVTMGTPFPSLSRRADRATTLAQGEATVGIGAS